MTLAEYAAALERSRKPGDAAVARYIRTHGARLRAWLSEAGRGLPASDREELTQVALLSIVEAVRGTGDADAALRAVHAAIEREGDHARSWRKRAVTGEEA